MPRQVRKLSGTEICQRHKCRHSPAGKTLQSQQRALKAINQEQLALYYGIGRYVSANTRKKNWGKGALATISEHLRKELPGLKGFSERNLKNMRTFFEEWRMLDNYNSAGGTAEFTEINTESSDQS